MKCPRCYSTNTRVEFIEKKKRLGFVRSMVYILLFIFVIIIWLVALLIPRGRRVKRIGVCDNCGNTWKLGYER